MAKETKVVRMNANKFRVFIVGGGYEYIKMMYELGYGGAKGLGDADIVLFTGGHDVTPELYGEKALSSTNNSVERDEREKIIYEEALKAGLPMVGICRGGQFLNVMNGGKMYQHVNNHCRNHDMVVIGNPNKTVKVTSTHHQMMRPNEEKCLVLAVAAEATQLSSYGLEINRVTPSMDDIEVVWYEDTACLCFQPHPEFAYAPPECRKYFEECMDNFVIPATYTQTGAK